jgi:hypothetical protein
LHYPFQYIVVETPPLGGWGVLPFPYLCGADMNLQVLLDGYKNNPRLFEEAGVFLPVKHNIIL